MMRNLFSTLALAGVLLLVPSLSSAQVTPPPGGQRQRLELERRLQQGFGRALQNQLGLDQTQLQGVQGVMQSFQEERQALNRAQASLRYRLRDPALTDMAEEEAMSLVREMVELQERELDLYKREQAELLKLMSPLQLLRLYRLRDDLGQRVQELRQGRGGGGGVGGVDATGHLPVAEAPGAPTSVDGGPRGIYPSGEGLPPSLFFLPMKIQILFFASYRDLLGTGEMTLHLPEGSSVAGMVAELRGRGEPFSTLPQHPVVAVNECYAPEDRILEEGDVVAFIPPVAGG